MKKATFLSTILFAFVLKANAQMTLANTFYAGAASIINLETAGKKFGIIDFTLNQCRLYNLDFSLYKTIAFPSVTGYVVSNAQDFKTAYVSEGLFNIDPSIEMAVLYATNPSSNIGKLLIINETGSILNTIDSVAYGMTIYEAATGVFNAIIPNIGNTKQTVYNLPGTIPCNICGNGLGLGIVTPKSSSLSDPVPNPSTQQTKLSFKLPIDAKEGEISIYSTEGKLIRTYKVDNTFGYITIDNSMLPAGVYYYNLMANDNVTIAKKMLVIR